MSTPTSRPINSAFALQEQSDPSVGAHVDRQQTPDLFPEHHRRHLEKLNGELQAQSESEVSISFSLPAESEPCPPIHVSSIPNQFPFGDMSDSNVRSYPGGHPCHMSARWGDISMLQELVDMACDISSTMFSYHLQILSETWDRHGILPKKWHFDNIDNVEQYPFAVTASSDVKRASSNETLIALKFLRPHYRSTGPEEPTAELFREVCIWSPLDHRHILPFLGIFIKESRLALVSQHQKNGSLYEFLLNNPDADRIQLLRSVASGLKYLHSLPVPVMHGDMRAMNVVVDDQGEPLLMDFGCSSFMNESGHAISSLSDQLCGTPRHMPPEKMLPGAYPITLQSDIWSFAMLCIEVFTNQCPFDHIANDGAVVVEVLVRRSHPPRPQGPFAAQLTDDIWHVLKRCWELDPSRRPSIDAIEASFALHRL
ncbi:hypothetical protein K443DRAFT_211262 [Laccaria amethystina LaAM-08-1]|uniref:Protein kinase domain-containing protein n=1 Tax=Laccaria amethystina LaAM-08-1 TaxID=1095629 RepID=A0A0C9WMN4_9AGAR|nr:hypothetical protein K443DRAFT_211262 [Laccaria amethystina LaAM-08-1]